MERIEEKLLPIGSVCESTGMRRSYIYDHMAKGNDFPRSVRIGPRSVRWKQSERYPALDLRSPNARRSAPTTR